MLLFQGETPNLCGLTSKKIDTSIRLCVLHMSWLVGLKQLVNITVSLQKEKLHHVTTMGGKDHRKKTKKTKSRVTERTKVQTPHGRLWKDLYCPPHGNKIRQ